MPNILHFEISRGELREIVETEYVCNSLCQSLRLKSLRLLPDTGSGQQWRYGRYQFWNSVQYGSWPCPEWPDYAVRCAWCDKVLWDVPADDATVDEQRDYVEAHNLATMTQNGVLYGLAWSRDGAGGWYWERAGTTAREVREWLGY